MVYNIYRPAERGKIAEKLLEKNITHFIPLIKSTRKWHDRNKIIYVPAFPSYIFVYLDELSGYREVLEIDGVYNYVKFGKITAILEQEVIIR
jgi:transcriptional antiterminator RfaH